MRKPDKREASEAARDGASLVANSGRGRMKGDARMPGLLVDYKHNAKTFTLTNKNWKKHRDDAWGEGHREPVISVVFEDDTKVGIIDWNLFMELTEGMRNA